MHCIDGLWCVQQNVVHQPTVSLTLILIWAMVRHCHHIFSMNGFEHSLLLLVLSYVTWITSMQCNNVDFRNHCAFWSLMKRFKSLTYLFFIWQYFSLSYNSFPQNVYTTIKQSNTYFVFKLIFMYFEMLISPQKLSIHSYEHLIYMIDINSHHWHKIIHDKRHEQKK